MPRAANRDVFINCPFDARYQPLFRAIVFVVIRSGFRARCALETDDGGENRFEKICMIMAECQYGIHDISRTQSDRTSRLPRFNMPLELGLFLGAKRFGRQRAKRCIIFDTKRYRYQQFISDIAGQDIHAHDGSPDLLIRELAGWLRDQSRDPLVPGGARMLKDFDVFRRDIPKVCRRRHLAPRELTFGDFVNMTGEYVAQLRAPIVRR